MEQLPNSGERPAARIEPGPGRRDRQDRRLLFGAFELVRSTGELFERSLCSRLRPVKLQPQPARVLCFLAERAGRLVTRAELQRHLWGDDYFVDQEQGLNYCIRTVRKALGDDAQAPVFIETIPSQGYRFVADVEVAERAADRPVVGKGSTPTHSRSGESLLVLALLGLLVGWVLSWRERD
jgi:DNA-binding winged helix-turn-helix (wHTH) protein